MKRHYFPRKVKHILKIAICEDQPQELETIHTYIAEYLSAQMAEAEVRLFSHPDALLMAMETESFHLYILDIVMPMVSGLELGKEIRHLDREAQIIYVTTEPQFALQAYAASPINYLIKPVDRQQLFDTLTLAVSKMDLTEEQTFTVRTTESLRIIKLADIACCEYRSHIVIFTLTNGEDIISRTIRESYAEYLSTILKDKRFLQSHTSFVVNMRRVERFAKDSFTLRGGKIIPIAPKQYATVRDTYMDYLMAKGN